MYYRSILIVSLLTCNYPAFAQTINHDNAFKADQLLKEGIEARKFQNFKLALSKLELAHQLAPTNSDILVQLGFSYYAQGNLEQAKKSFEEALSISPNYVDAQYGLVSIVLAQNVDHPNEAETLLNQYLKQSPDDIQLLNLKKTIKAIKDDTHNWNLYLTTIHSHLSKSYSDWNEIEIALSYKISNENTITGHFTQSNRFDMNDQKYGTTFWHTFNNRANGYLSGFIAPSEKFFAKYTISSGIDFTLLKSTNEYLNSLHTTVDMKLDHYSDGNIKSIALGLEQFFFGDKLSISGKWYNTFDQSNNHMNGFLVKFTGSPTEKLHLFAGYSDSQETSERSSGFNHSLIKVNATFVGLSYEIYKRLTAYLDYTDEDRKYSNQSHKLYNKKTIGCGIRWTF